MHTRLGYYNNNSLQNLTKNIINANNSPTKVKNCEICLKANMQNKRYKEKDIIDNYNILNKVYNDLIGLIYPTDFFGNKYIITFLNSRSRYLEINLIKNKDQSLSYFKAFKAKTENNPYNYKIRNFKTNNRKEYLNNEFISFLKKEGINYEYSSPYMPK